MALKRRSIKLEIERVVLEGIELSRPDIFARAFEDECIELLAAAKFDRGATAGERISINLALNANADAIGRELARQIVALVTRR
jgi:hypothetical protein